MSYKIYYVCFFFCFYSNLVFADYNSLFCKTNNLLKKNDKFYYKNKSKLIQEIKQNKQCITEISEELKTFFIAWIKSRISGDFNFFIDFYDLTFANNEKKIQKWLKIKQKNERFKLLNPKIIYSKILLKKTAIDTYMIFFIQDFKHKTYNDFGFKLIEVVKRPKSYRIIDEKFISITKFSDYKNIVNITTDIEEKEIFKNRFKKLKLSKQIDSNKKEEEEKTSERR